MNSRLIRFAVHFSAFVVFTSVVQAQPDPSAGIRTLYRAWVRDMDSKVLSRADRVLPDGTKTRLGVGPELFDDYAKKLESTQSLLKFDAGQLLLFLNTELASERATSTSPLLPSLICEIIQVDLFDVIGRSEEIIAATTAPGGKPLELTKPFGPRWMSQGDLLLLMERLINANEAKAGIVRDLQAMRAKARPAAPP